MCDNLEHGRGHPGIPLRTLVPEPQMAEQLVEVPTIISYSSLQRTVEQHVDIPVPGGGGPSSGVQGCLPRQSIVTLSSKKRFSERIVEQIVDTPVFRGGVEVLKVFTQDKVHLRLRTVQLEFLKTQMSLVMVFFRTFPRKKKSAEVAGQVSADLPRHVSAWTPAAYVQPTGFHEEEKEKEKKLEDVRVTEKLIAEAKERRMQRIQVKVRDNLPLTSADREEWRRWAGIEQSSSSTSSAQRRKRKKKRRKRRP